MGSICSCFCVEGFEEFRNPRVSVQRQCICFSFLAQHLMHMYTLILQREDHILPSTSSNSVVPTSDDSFSGTFRSSPRPLPFDDPRCSRSHTGDPATGHDKPLNRVDEEAEPFRRFKNVFRAESTSVEAKWSRYNNGISKKDCSEHPSIEITSGVAYIFPSSEEEDVCPTCLEEYSSENPRIILQCSHHFHLGCIYEWMERSELCPVCGKGAANNDIRKLCLIHPAMMNPQKNHGNPQFHRVCPLQKAHLNGRTSRCHVAELHLIHQHAPSKAQGFHTKPVFAQGPHKY